MRAIVLALLALLLAACVAPSIPDAPVALPVSPLPVPPQAVSPLPPPGRVGSPDIVVVSKAYMPLAQAGIVAEVLPCAQNATSLRMAEIFATAAWQQRDNPRCAPLLALAAQRKAADMLEYRYFSHIMHNGDSANQNVRNTGWILPPFYILGNNVESIGLNYGTPELMFIAWAFSASHGPHITGNVDFFREQRCFGTGFSEGEGDAGRYYVLISAPCN